ncbi:hypothetical protein TrVGV298_000453 [Trichoderma virens]|nr:hypothetical protein TrVGV298_000453 [Trichoderma virens]
MDKIQDVTRFLLAAGGSPSADGKSTHLFYEEKNALYMETWTNTELSDRVQVVAGVRTGTSAPCFTETLRAEDEDDDEDDEEEEELWENEELDDVTVALHQKSQLAVSCGDSAIVVFYQKPDGTLGAIEDDGDGWKVAELPSSEAFPGTALASFQAEDAAYFVYVGAEGALRFMEHSNNEWKDLSFSSVKVDGATARLSVAEDEQAESSPKLLVFSLADNKLSTIKLGSTEAEILGTVRDREFKPVSDQECGAALGEYLYLGTAPFRRRAFARNTCQEYGEDEESCEDEPAVSVIVAPFQALAFDPYYGPYDAFRSHDPFRPYDAFRSFDPYDPFYSDFHHMNMRDEPEYYQARYPLRYAPPAPPSPLPLIKLLLTRGNLKMREIPARQTAREDPPPPQETSRQHPPPPPLPPKVEAESVAPKVEEESEEEYEPVLDPPHPPLPKTMSALSKLFEKSMSVLSEQNVSVANVNVVISSQNMSALSEQNANVLLKQILGVLLRQSVSVKLLTQNVNVNVLVKKNASAPSKKNMSVFFERTVSVKLVKLNGNAPASVFFEKVVKLLRQSVSVSVKHILNVLFEKSVSVKLKRRSENVNVKLKRQSENVLVKQNVRIFFEKAVKLLRQSVNVLVEQNMSVCEKNSSSVNVNEQNLSVLFKKNVSVKLKRQSVNVLNKQTRNVLVKQDRIALVNLVPMII